MYIIEDITQEFQIISQVLNFNQNIMFTFLKKIKYTYAQKSSYYLWNESVGFRKRKSLTQKEIGWRVKMVKCIF